MTQKPLTFETILRELAHSCPAFLGSKSNASQCLKEMADIISKELQQGRSVRIPNIGVFSPVNKPARQGRNPKTGEEMIFPKKNTVKFKPLGTVKNYAKQKD